MKTTFFKQNKTGLKEMNLSIWNNEEVTSITGYSITDLKQCLFDLSQFIAQNLSPNRLIGFDIQAIKNAEPYH